MRLAAIATGSDRSNRHNFEIRSDAPIRSLPQRDQSGPLEYRAVARLEPVSPASPAARIGPIRLRDLLLTRARQPGLRTLLHDWLRNSRPEAPSFAWARASESKANGVGQASRAGALPDVSYLPHAERICSTCRIAALRTQSEG